MLSLSTNQVKDVELLRVADLLPLNSSFQTSAVSLERFLEAAIDLGQSGTPASAAASSTAPNTPSIAPAPGLADPTDAPPPLDPLPFPAPPASTSSAAPGVTLLVAKGGAKGRKHNVGSAAAAKRGEESSSGEATANQLLAWTKAALPESTSARVVLGTALAAAVAAMAVRFLAVRSRNK